MKSVIRKIIEKLYRYPIITISLILFIIALALFIPTDPDFFWHLRYGELTLKNGPISYDPFSYTFSNYHFYDFEWLSNTPMFIMYRIGGLYLVSIFFGIVIVLALWVATNIKLQEKPPLVFKLLMICVGLIVLITITGVRIQMVSVLFFALTYSILIKFLQGKTKIIFILPFLMILWTNLHPGFTAGLLLLIITTTAEITKIILKALDIPFARDQKTIKPQQLKLLLIVTVLSFIATCFTPFGYKLLLEVIHFSFDPNAQAGIIEWLAPDFHNLSGKLFVIYSLIVTASFFFRRKVDITEVILILAFNIMTFQSIRHLALFVIVTIPTILALKEWNILSKIKLDNLFPLFVKISILIASISLLIPTINGFISTNSKLENVYKASKYPYKAVSFLKTHPYEGNMLNEYNFGGFLIWAYPEKKTFIDGRMTSWMIEGQSALREYSNFIRLKIPNWKTKLEKYNITIVFVYKTTPIGNALYSDPEWEKVYEDNLVVIYHKKTSK